MIQGGLDEMERRVLFLPFDIMSSMTRQIMRAWAFREHGQYSLRLPRRTGEYASSASASCDPY